MAVVWKKNIGGTLYEVRSAGRSMRLYTNSVHHSQYNPGKCVANGIWDLLLLPSFFYPRGSIRRVLVLGVGGGSVLHLIKTHIQPDEIIGIELSPVHLTVARKFFGVTPRVAKLVNADAADWLNGYDGEPFDLIIDDLYGDRDGEPVRAVELDMRWFSLLNKNLTKKGMLVCNTISGKELKGSAYYTRTRARRMFRQAFRFSLPGYDNCIGAFLKTESTVKIMRRHISGTEPAGARRQLESLDYTVSRG